VAHSLFGFDIDRAFDYENGFYLTSDVRRLGKILAQYELYKRIVGLPGEVIECGVYKAASLMRLLTFREMLETEHSRKVIAFDAFGRFPTTADEQDTEFIADFEREGGDGIGVDALERVLEHKGFGNVELVAGNINATLPDYVKRHPELRVSLLHVDVDCYEPTVTILEQLFDRLVVGGLLVLDDYASVAGETRATDEFFRERRCRLEKLPLSHKSIFVVK
jgi:hypothetical protein